MRIVIAGLSITSSWGNGHATNYRALARALHRRRHDVLFLERDVPWYAAHRDEPRPWGTRTELYSSVGELIGLFGDDIEAADLVIVGSYVPDGAEVASYVTDTARLSMFYDIDTPVTVAALAHGDCEYLTSALIPRFDAHLSFTGGPMLDRLEREFGARRAVAFHCLVDADAYAPRAVPTCWDLGYLGTYSDDRQPAVERLLLDSARARADLRFVVAGPQYPPDIEWPRNVDRIDHLPPGEHAAFYAAQRAALNVTRADMIDAGWSPSVRLFEAAACAVPVLSDRWPGIGEFFAADSEILLVDDTEDVLAALDRLTDERRDAIGNAARARVLAAHTAAHRVSMIEDLVAELNCAGGSS